MTYLSHDNQKLEVGNYVWYEQDDEIKSGKITHLYDNNKATIDGYLETRIDKLFVNHDILINYQNSLIFKTGSESDLLLIRYSLEKQLGINLYVLSILKKAKDREITQEEEESLPYSLVALSREKLVEQINPWKTLISDYRDLIENVEKVLRIHRTCA